MPMFETPKPKQFRYKPRFYDPEKERWEALKQKYADQKFMESGEWDAENSMVSDTTTTDYQAPATDDKDLEYFQQRVRELDRQKSSKLTWKDMFRRREMPKFNYQPRFATNEATTVAKEEGTAEHIADFKRRGIKIKRRFDLDNPDDNTLKPVPAGRIMLYALLAALLLYWIIM